METDQAIGFLEDAAKKERPFYLNLWYHAPHEPLSDKVKEAALYKDEDRKKQVYYGTVTNMDRNVGRILDALARLGLEENTLVIFSSDNGPEVWGFTFSRGSAGRLRGWKTQLWEGGVRVPFIARWPGRIPPGKTSGTVTSALDYVPTICEVTGAKAPDKLDGGLSLLPLLTGKGTLPSRTLFWEFHHGQRGGPTSGSLVVRDGDWKLHLYQKEGKKALFDMAKDEGESTDVSGAHPEVVRRLERLALGWFATLPKETEAKKKRPVPASEEEANRLP